MRYIKNCNPSTLNKEFLASTAWDIIELELTVDPKQLDEYYTILKTELADFCFSFDSKEYLRPEIYERYQQEGRVGNYIGNVNAWSVSWPVERDIPCPSKKQANPDVYPEIKDITHTAFTETAHPQKRYVFGILEKLLDSLTERALRQILIARHPAGLRVVTHVDSDLKKLHIPLYTNAEAVFTFGEHGERVYQMEVGKIYIINPIVPHGTFNGGDTERVHLLSRIDLDYIPEVVGMQGNIE
jgi:hypothetical protein